MILKLRPYFENKPWHGNLLSKMYDCDEETGEAWIISGYNHKSSIITNLDKEISLYDFYHQNRSLFTYKSEEFPLLLKIIDASDDLSIQVHPNDEYAKKRHNQLGKYECWYFFQETTAKDVVISSKIKNKAEMEDCIKTQCLGNVINNEPIFPKAFIPIKPGTLHALKGGSFILEIQQSSDITYRIYDYNRLPKRELHLEDALEVLEYNQNIEIKNFSNEGYDDNEYFSVIKKQYQTQELLFDQTTIIFVSDGVGYLNNQIVKKYDAFIISNEKIEISGNVELFIILSKN